MARFVGQQPHSEHERHSPAHQQPAAYPTHDAHQTSTMDPAPQHPTRPHHPNYSAGHCQSSPRHGVSPSTTRGHDSFHGADAEAGSSSSRLPHRHYVQWPPAPPSHPSHTSLAKGEYEGRRLDHSDSLSSASSAVSNPGRRQHAAPATPPASHGEMALSSSSVQQQQAGSDRKISCLECRSSKVKCSGRAEGGCNRCQRLQRACVFEQHRRGRKPAHVKMHKLEQSVDTIMTAINALREYSGKKDALREMVDETCVEQGGARKRRVDGSTGGGAARAVRSGEQDESPQSGAAIAADSMEPPLKLMRRPGTEYRDKPAKTLSNSTSLVRQGDELEAHVEAERVQELGLFSLSNPLKLLAQASDSALCQRSADPNPVSNAKNKTGEDKGDEDGAYASLQADMRSGRAKQAGVASRKAAPPPKQRGASRREYWEMGLYSSRLDQDATLDPIACQIMTTEVAHDLYNYYLRHLNFRITLLDPKVSTFQHVSKHSALLLTTACALAARFADHIDEAEELAKNLDAHIQRTLLPAVLLQGYRSVEIAQAFIIMAAYHANTASLDGDRSWSLLGYGIRIAAELDMNARMQSERQGKQGIQTPAVVLPDLLGDDGARMSAEEQYQRRMRDRERTWCNLWLFENSLSTHMGRRSTLGQDPVILGVGAGWHRAQYAIPGDEAIVALINLRRLQTKNVEFFEHSVLGNVKSDSIAPPSLRFQLDYYRRSCSADLSAWIATYVEGEEGQSYRMDNGRLYASYAHLILNSYALKSTTDEALLEPIYKDSYGAAMTYLTLFAERLHSSELVYVHNSGE